MNPRINPNSNHFVLPDPGRRSLLAGVSGLLLTGAAAAMTGCAAPPPEADPFDPSSLVYPPPPETPRFYYDRTIWGSNAVIEETSTDRFRRFATGESVRGQGLAKPFGVVARNGRVFVSDTVSRRVHVFDYPRKRYYAIGTKGVGSLKKPLGLATDNAGKLYVVDGTTKRVMVYDLEGNYLTAIAIDSGLERPTGIAVTPEGDQIYVVDTGGVQSRDHGVHIFDRRGKKIRAITTRGNDEGEFNLPLDCALAPDGNLYVLDTGNFRIQVLDGEGGFLRAFGEAGRYPGQFGHPKGIAIDSEGKVYVSDTNFGIFQIFNSNDQMLMAVGARSEEGGPGKFLLPAGISVDVDGRIYVVEQFFRKTEVFRPAALPEDWPIGQDVA
jgi:DNA-binding beta-propeller fold protein YncE